MLNLRRITEQEAPRAASIAIPTAAIPENVPGCGSR